jgi:hypothetical protein
MFGFTQVSSMKTRRVGSRLALTRFPAFAFARDVRAILFAGEHGFLKLRPSSRTKV